MSETANGDDTATRTDTVDPAVGVDPAGDDNGGLGADHGGHDHGDPGSGGDLHTIVIRRLRHVGQRFTSQRQALVEVLASAPAPLTLPQLLERSEGLAQSSAYRNLAVLERAGVAHRIVTTGDHACWELAEDLTEHHHHLICNGCGDVTDFTVPGEVEKRLDTALAEIADGVGFSPLHHRLDLVGLCARCQ
jgi:Fur family transcriptional regulator, ferric uptake regulator